MSLRQALRGLARTAAASKEALPTRGGAGAPIKLAPRPDKPLPLWYDMWWDNGIFPGQPAVDYMFGPHPANLTEAWYFKAWFFLGIALAAPVYYCMNYVDEFRMPMVPPQYPPEVRKVLIQSANSNTLYDYSAPDYEELKDRRKSFWTMFA